MIRLFKKVVVSVTTGNSLISVCRPRRVAGILFTTEELMKTGKSRIIVDGNHVGASAIELKSAWGCDTCGRTDSQDGRVFTNETLLLLTDK